MFLFLDVVSPIPEFHLIKDKKIIVSTKIIENNDEKLSDTIIPKYLKISENNFRRTKKELEIISGEDAFKLYDTYGFPVDLTRLMSNEHGFEVDENCFEKLMKEQQERAREAGKFKTIPDKWSEISEGPDSKFVGYDTFITESKLRRFSQNDSGQWQFILDTTPFYAESGGQVGDHGILQQNDSIWNVVDVQKMGDSIIHICEANNKNLKNIVPDNSTITASVDEKSRLSTTNNHTTAHLMHEALRQVLGEHVTQAGSLVNPQMLRFDFTHFEKVSDTQLEEIENIVNLVIRQNINTDIYETPYDEAISSGIIAQFGEKYGDVVRVVKISNFSEELCGGCHVKATGQIGQFRLVSEEGIAAGIRRVVAVTGKQAELMTQEQGRVARALRQLLNVPEAQIPEMAEKLAEEKRQLEKEVQSLRSKAALEGISELVAQAEEVEGVSVLAREIEANSADTLREIGHSVREQISSGIAWLATTMDEKSTLLCVVSDDLIQRGIKAGDMVNEVAKLADGRGGGKPNMAQAGIKAPEKIPSALAAATEIVREKLAN